VPTGHSTPRYKAAVLRSDTVNHRHQEACHEIQTPLESMKGRSKAVGERPAYRPGRRTDPLSVSVVPARSNQVVELSNEALRCLGASREEGCDEWLARALGDSAGQGPLPLTALVIWATWASKLDSYFAPVLEHKVKHLTHKPSPYWSRTVEGVQF
jgi:hypothetical protein